MCRKPVGEGAKRTMGGMAALLSTAPPAVTGRSGPTSTMTSYPSRMTGHSPLGRGPPGGRRRDAGNERGRWGGAGRLPSCCTLTNVFHVKHASAPLSHVPIELPLDGSHPRAIVAPVAAVMSADGPDRSPRG